jgi:hypothetical protein
MECSRRFSERRKSATPKQSPDAGFHFPILLERRRVSHSPNVHFRASEKLNDQFYFHRGSKRNLSNPEGAAHVLPYIAEYFSEKLRRTVGH